MQMQRMPQEFNHTVQMQRTPQECNHTVQMQRMPQGFNHTVQMQITSYSRWRDACQTQRSASRRWDGSWKAFHNKLRRCVCRSVPVGSNDGRLIRAAAISTDGCAAGSLQVPVGLSGQSLCQHRVHFDNLCVSTVLMPEFIRTCHSTGDRFQILFDLAFPGGCICTVHIVSALVFRCRCRQHRRRPCSNVAVALGAVARVSQHACLFVFDVLVPGTCQAIIKSWRHRRPEAPTSTPQCNRCRCPQATTNIIKSWGHRRHRLGRQVVDTFCIY